MNRYFSGVQATGNLHLGNYLGALKPWVDLQEKGECIFFVPDLHSLNVRPKPDALRESTLSTVAWMLAAGINTETSIIFVQSQVSVHAELAVILENFVTVGELGRMTQYKDKATKRGPAGQLAALFTYPVLMAADILLYDATHVPVGDDQKQHVELARDIAVRFNGAYGETFSIPEPLFSGAARRIMSLQNPGAKMSKSDTDQSGIILMLDTPEAIRKKISRSVTDSDNTVEVGDHKAAITNLLNIYSAVSGEGVEIISSRFADSGYGAFKSDLAELVASHLEPIQDRYRTLIAKPDVLLAHLANGRTKAQALAEIKIADVKRKIGLVT